MKQAFVFANGDICDGPMVRRALSSAVNPLVIAADGGARLASYFDLRLNAIVGDMDSLSVEELDAFIAQGVEIRLHPLEKDYTDLELALYQARELGADWLRIIGGIGDRIDQTLANIQLLALPALAGCDARLVAGKQEVRLLRPGKHIINGATGDTISLLPFNGNAVGVSTKKLYYTLHNETLYWGSSRGISNVLDQETAQITFREGLLLLIHTLGKA